MPRTYAEAGVDLDEEEATVAALSEGLGGQLEEGRYAGLVPFGDHQLAMTTDGVGTKILVARHLDKWDTIGIDCIAMNINDLLCVGAEPLAFVDYLAVEHHDPDVAEQIAAGLAEGAKRADIRIVGGETATMPEVIDGLDLAGSAVGAVPTDEVVTGEEIRPGDVLVGLPSSGLHSNGYTLARGIVEEARLAYTDDWPGDDTGTVGEVLLEPTRIYTDPVLRLLDVADVRGLAHITGGGLANLARLGDDVGYAIDDPLPVPDVFDTLQELGDVTDEEMHRVYNMGTGFVAVVGEDHAEVAVEAVAEGAVVGRVVEEPGVRVRGLELGG